MEHEPAAAPQPWKPGDVLTAFIAARLDEDEAIARAAGDATPPPWHAAGGDIMSRADGRCAANADGPEAPHIARHDPARVLREVAAKRAMVAECVRTCEYEDYGHALAGAVIKVMAAAWSDHPDYRQEWAS